MKPIAGLTEGSAALGFNIDNDQYLAELKTFLDRFTTTPRLVTYLQVPCDLKLTENILEQWKEQFLDREDVFHVGFLQVIILGRINNC